jgi:hypothetical protein
MARMEVSAACHRRLDVGFTDAMLSKRCKRCKPSSEAEALGTRRSNRYLKQEALSPHPGGCRRRRGLTDLTSESAAATGYLPLMRALRRNKDFRSHLHVAQTLLVCLFWRCRAALSSKLYPRKGLSKT